MSTLLPSARTVETAVPVSRSARAGSSRARRSRCACLAGAAAKIVATTRPRPSTIGPPELPERTSPRRVVTGGASGRGRRRPGRSPSRSAEPRRARRRTARSREAEDRRGRARLRAHVHRSAACRDIAGARSTARSLPRVEPDHVGVVARPVALDLHGRVVLARDDVRVGDDDPVAAPPSPSPPRPGRTPSPAPSRRSAPPPAPPGRARSASRRRPTRPRGPVDLGIGSKRASAFSIGPDGGKGRVQPLRIVERWMSRRSSRAPGRLERHRARDPGDPEADAPQQDRAADAVERPEPVAACAPRSGNPAVSSTRRQDAADHERAHQRDERRVRRLGALLEQQRPDPRAEHRADREAEQATGRRRSAPGRSPRRAIASVKPTMIQSIAVTAGEDRCRSGAARPPVGDYYSLAVRAAPMNPASRRRRRRLTPRAAPRCAIAVARRGRSWSRARRRAPPRVRRPRAPRPTSAAWEERDYAGDVPAS